MKKTKIVATIGPASEEKELLRQLVNEGMNVARLNFSHGSHEEHRVKIERLKELRREMHVPLAIALDTKGPEIRLGTFKDDQKVDLAIGDEITLTTRDVEGTKDIVHITYAGLPQDVAPGKRLLIDDGLVELEVVAIENGTDIRCRALNFGTISNRKGVNVPATDIKLPALTDQDKADILFGIEAGVDLIFASFIRSGADVNAIRALLEDNGGGHIHVYAKIESEQGVNNLDEIVDAADGIMVARGDLGVEVPNERVPIVQKQIIRAANLAGKPVITATQMLDSMQRNPRPTRAEVNDVANAILDGSDAVMLSGETAAGKYPVQAVRQMRVIAETTEKSPDFLHSIEDRNTWVSRDVSSAICRSTCQMASQVMVAAIVASTASGFTGRQISRYRPLTPIIAVTPNEAVYHQLSIAWGVTPVLSQVSTETDELIDRSIMAALSTGLCQQGDQIILTAGLPVGQGASTNFIKVHTIGNILASGQGIGRGLVVGKVIVGSTAKELADKYVPGCILVARFTGADMIPYIEKAGAVVVEEGGLTSHAAIVGLHYGVPTIIGVNHASKVLSDGDEVTVDATTGVVYAGSQTIV
ncbi:MAG: pyruvate kinase [Peptoniphilaceae bacterium]|nr:pyruvate kinase [Peptoniphilaceae bacterium]MDY6085673.1 pyruvate kinase [Peptoniphilaceae bacterium]